jgi:uncharacterized membrane protein YphA (DoxX/SURF4 family)
VGVAASGRDRFAADMHAVSPRAFRRAFADGNGVRISSQEVSAPCPTLLVAGEREAKAVRAANAALAALLPNAAARFAPGRGHGWLAVEPELHCRMVAVWITGRSSRWSSRLRPPHGHAARSLASWAGRWRSWEEPRHGDEPGTVWGLVTGGWHARSDVAGDREEVAGMLLRVLLGLFFIAHGLIHVAIWAPRYDPTKAAFDASRSWLLGERRPLARVLAFGAAAILIVAGIALLAQGDWWRPTAVVGLGMSTVLLLVYFTPWYLFILVVNLALIVGIVWRDWPATSTVGA